MGPQRRTSAYGLSFSIENLADSVAAAYFAAADSCPTFPTRSLSNEFPTIFTYAYPNHSCSRLAMGQSMCAQKQAVKRLTALQLNQRNLHDRDTEGDYLQ